VLTKLSYLIDNPWSNSLERAKAAGGVLADILINRQLGVRPVSLIGFSLGARVIFYALAELAKAKAFGVVQEVYLMGATVTAPTKTWTQIRGVVSGRFVNAYATNDWLLAYLFRASHAGMATVAGLRPVDGVHGIENVDVSEIVVGHMSYRKCMPQLLQKLGFRTTADHFDEPDDMDMEAPEREVVTPEEEERRSLEKVKKKKSSFGFGRRKKASKESSADQTSSSSPVTPADSKDEEDDDLPPRVEFDEESSSAEKDAAAEEPSKEPEVQKAVPSTTSPEGDVGEPSAATSTAGFDLEQLRKELEKAEAKPFEEREAESFPIAASDVDAHDTSSSSRPESSDSTPTRGRSPAFSPSPPPAAVDPQDDLRRNWQQGFRALSDDGWNPSSAFHHHLDHSGLGPSSAGGGPSLTFADANGDLDALSLPPLKSDGVGAAATASAASFSSNPFAESPSSSRFGGGTAHDYDYPTSGASTTETNMPTLSFGGLDGTISFPLTAGERPHLRSGDDGGAFPISSGYEWSSSSASLPLSSAAGAGAAVGVSAGSSPFRAANPWSDERPPPPPSVRAKTGGAGGGVWP
jgi:hypothetical protein